LAGADQLEAAGGAFGWVLEMLRRWSAAPDDFRALVARAVGHLEEMAAAERERWLLPLSYILAMI
jgi:hypothetical protein